MKNPIEVQAGIEDAKKKPINWAKVPGIGRIYKWYKSKRSFAPLIEESEVINNDKSKLRKAWDGVKAFPGILVSFVKVTARHGWHFFTTDSKVVVGALGAGIVLGAFAGAGFYTLPFTGMALGWLGISLGSPLAIVILAAATGLAAYFVAQQAMHLWKSLENLIQGRKIERSGIRLGVSLAAAIAAAVLLYVFFPQLILIAGSTFGAAVVAGILTATGIALVTWLAKHTIRAVSYFKFNNSNPEKFTLTQAQAAKLIHNLGITDQDEANSLLENYDKLVTDYYNSAEDGATPDANKHAFLRNQLELIKQGKLAISIMPSSVFVEKIAEKNSGKELRDDANNEAEVTGMSYQFTVADLQKALGAALNHEPASAEEQNKSKNALVIGTNKDYVRFGFTSCSRAVEDDEKSRGFLSTAKKYEVSHTSSPIQST